MRLSHYLNTEQLREPTTNPFSTLVAYGDAPSCRSAVNSDQLSSATSPKLSTIPSHSSQLNSRVTTHLCPGRNTLSAGHKHKLLTAKTCSLQCGRAPALTTPPVSETAPNSCIRLLHSTTAEQIFF